MDVGEYLKRVDYDGPLTPDLETLNALHRAHLLAVPFENLDIGRGVPIVLDIEKLHAKIVAALSEPRLREQLKTEGATAVGNTPKEFTAFVRGDIERWAPVGRATGAKPN